MVCRRCFHNQLSVVVDPDLMFRHYLYVSGTSRTFREHFADLAREALFWVTPRPRRVLDLACNDGTLLEAFHREGCEVHGVDPASNLAAIAASKGINVTEGYWPEVRHRVAGRFDVITATNVLAHVADPAAFLAAALDSLTDHGLVIIELPYCRELILHCEWDTIYHEHLSYFLVSPLIGLVESLEARIVQARPVPIHGGSLRLAIRRAGGSHCPEVRSLANSERERGLLEMRTYKRFAEQVTEKCRQLQKLVERLHESGKRVVGYGASAKGNTLLNHCPSPLAYIVDDSPMKHGYLTPGQHIPICSPKILLDEGRELYVLLLAWNFASEITQNLRTWRPGRGDHVIYYVPQVSCQPVDAAAAVTD
jgi:SAM-dependent methyltransferase